MFKSSRITKRPGKGKRRVNYVKKQKTPIQTVDSKYITKIGVKVRSKAERVIADCLTSKNLKYEYEKKFYYMGDEYVLSDFYLPDYDCYIEYFGMVDHYDDKTRKEYESKTKWKIELYRRWNKKLIYLYPKDVQSPKFNQRFEFKLKFIQSQK